jgi:hypothetical protein
MARSVTTTGRLAVCLPHGGKPAGNYAPGDTKTIAPAITVMSLHRAQLSGCCCPGRRELSPPVTRGGPPIY